jgi:uncharacterized protein (TIGR03083 family)
MDRDTVIETEARRFADVLGNTAPDAHCPTCPEWNAADLLWHLTQVHAFWAEILSQKVQTAADAEALEQSAPQRPASIADMLPVREQVTEALLDQLETLDDAEPRWSWWEPDQTVGFTRRMQTYEATMHRVDAERTAGLPVEPIAADVAVGAVDHCVDVMWGWTPDWADYQQQALADFAATDSGDRWLVEVGHWSGTGPESGKYFDVPRAVRATGGDADVVVRAPAMDLALWAWTRGGTVDIDGPAESRAALDTLIANGIP